MTRFVIGVDGGGTSMRAVVLDEDGIERGRAEVAGAVVRADDAGPAATAVEAAVRAAAAAAGVDLPVEALLAGLAGAGRAEPRNAAERILRDAGLARFSQVRTDVEAAFSDAFGEDPGLLLIAGTGSVLWARSTAGTLFRVGGWGADIGDEGSGSWIGREALRVVSHASDGRGKPTALEALVLDHTRCARAEDLITWASGASKSDIASLAPLVLGAAQDGDRVAESISAAAVSALVRHIGSALSRGGDWGGDAPLALWGGLVWDEGPLRAPLIEALRDLPVRLVQKQLDPPAGAARLALEMLS